MIKNSSYLVLSFFIKCKEIIKLESDDFSKVFKTNKSDYYRFINSNDFNKRNVIRIYNEIENNFYTYKDIIIFILYNYAFNKNIKINEISYNNIKEVFKIFSKKQIENDKKFIIELNKKIKFKNIKEFFEIKENGEPIIYTLIKNNYISPAIYIKLYKKILTLKNKDVIIINKDYRKFEYAMKNIIKIIKGGLNE